LELRWAPPSRWPGLAAWDGWSGREKTIVFAFCFFPSLGGLIGGAVAGTRGDGAGGLAIEATFGGLLGAWLQFLVVLVLSYGADDYDLTGYSMPFIFALIFLVGAPPPFLGSILGAKIAECTASGLARRRSR
jgi:hypothetical protein